MSKRHIANMVRRLVTTDQETRRFFGGPPFTGDTEREMANFRKYAHGKLPTRARTNLGCCVFGPCGKVIGYQATTIMRGATPTQYDRAYIGLKKGLAYVQLKKLVVHPAARGTGLAKRLLDISIGFARRLNMSWVVDVKAENARMIAFLAKHGISKLFRWNTPSGALMWRLRLQDSKIPR